MHAFELMGLASEKMVIEDFYDWNKKQTLTSKQLIDQHLGEGLKMTIPGNSYKILKIRK